MEPTSSSLRTESRQAGQLADSYVKYNSSNKPSENKLLPASNRLDSSDFARMTSEKGSSTRQKGAFNRMLNYPDANPNEIDTITVDELKERVGEPLDRGAALKAFREQVAKIDR